MKSKDIKTTYYDALFFASSTDNEKKDFFLRFAEFKVLLKLIHYDSNQKYITWSSENIGKHITASIGSVDKAVQRLKQKGYINVQTTQEGRTFKKRTITINWDFIKSIDDIYKLYIESLDDVVEEFEEEVNEEPIQEEITQPEAPKEEKKVDEAPEFVTLDNGVEVQIPIEFKDFWTTIKHKPNYIKKLVANKYPALFCIDLEDAYNQSGYKFRLEGIK